MGKRRNGKGKGRNRGVRLELGDTPHQEAIKKEYRWLVHAFSSKPDRKSTPEELTKWMGQDCNAQAVEPALWKLKDDGVLKYDSESNRWESKLSKEGLISLLMTLDPEFNRKMMPILDRITELLR